MLACDHQNHRIASNIGSTNAARLEAWAGNMGAHMQSLWCQPTDVLEHLTVWVDIPPKFGPLLDVFRSLRSTSTMQSVSSRNKFHRSVQSCCSLHFYGLKASVCGQKAALAGNTCMSFSQFRTNSRPFLVEHKSGMKSLAARFYLCCSSLEPSMSSMST